MNLDTLFLARATDKGSSGHDYAASYEKLLAPFRDREITLLEIGVGTGGSLEAWREYLPQALVFGIDHDEVEEELARGGLAVGVAPVVPDVGVLHDIDATGGNTREEDLEAADLLRGLVATVVDDDVWSADRADHAFEESCVCLVADEDAGAGRSGHLVVVDPEH